MSAPTPESAGERCTVPDDPRVDLLAREWAGKPNWVDEDDRRHARDLLARLDAVAPPATGTRPQAGDGQRKALVEAFAHAKVDYDDYSHEWVEPGTIAATVMADVALAALPAVPGDDPQLVTALAAADRAVAFAQVTAGDETTARHLAAAAHALRDIRDRLTRPAPEGGERR